MGAAYNDEMRSAAVVMLLASLSLIGCGTNRATEASPCAAPVISVQAVPQLGEHLSNLPESCVLTMAASAQMWPSYQADAREATFTVGVDRDAVVHFISTSDKRFSPPEGLHIGDAAAAAIAASPRESVELEPGWGWYILLPSGWYAFLDDSEMNSSGQLDLNLGTRPLQADAHITMFFRR